MGPTPLRQLLLCTHFTEGHVADILEAQCRQGEDQAPIIRHGQLGAKVLM